MFKRTSLSLAVGAAFSVGIAGMAPAAAQTQPDAQKLERVEVTGSLIRRVESELALPVTTLRLDELQRAGVTNAEQAVQFITQQQGGAVSSGSVSAGNGAASYANLRSLGSNRTLVLLNGKRVTNNPFSSQAVDLNTLPIGAIDRIEVLSDGASAIYGTDAIAGVINFITRKEYSGLTLAAEAQIPQQGGGEIYVGQITGGYGDLTKQGWNVYGGFYYRQQEPMGGTERGFSQTSYIPEKGFNGLSPTTFPANYSQTVAGRTTIAATNPSLPNCDPPTSILTLPPIGLGSTRCGADTQSWTNTVPEQDQWSLFLRGSVSLGSSNTAYAEYFRAYNKITNQIAPSPEAGLSMRPTSPYYPGNGITPITNTALNRTQPISINWRTTVLGPRQTETDNTTQRILAGLDGSAAGWDYNVAAFWSNADISQNFLNGYPSRSFHQCSYEKAYTCHDSTSLQEGGDHGKEVQACGAGLVAGAKGYAEGTVGLAHGAGA